MSDNEMRPFMNSQYCLRYLITIKKNILYK